MELLSLLAGLPALIICLALLKEFLLHGILESFFVLIYLIGGWMALYFVWLGNTR